MEIIKNNIKPIAIYTVTVVAITYAVISASMKFTNQEYITKGSWVSKFEIQKNYMPKKESEQLLNEIKVAMDKINTLKKEISLAFDKKKYCDFVSIELKRLKKIGMK